MDPAPIKEPLFPGAKGVARAWTLWFKQCFGLSADKADKVTDATENNFASFDDEGNLKDSGQGSALSGDVVGTSDTQTLTNKTLTSPTITNPTMSGNVVLSELTATRIMHTGTGGLVGVCDDLSFYVTGSTNVTVTGDGAGKVALDTNGYTGNVYTGAVHLTISKGIITAAELSALPAQVT